MYRRVLVVMILPLAACEFTGLVGGPTDGGRGRDGPVTFDAMIDAIPGDAPAMCEQWVPRPQHFEPCGIPAPGANPWLVGGSHVYNTTTDELDGVPITDTIGPGKSTTFDQGTNQVVRLLSVPYFKVEGGGQLQVIGDLPLIIASWTTIDIDGTLDAGSYSTLGIAGAGADPQACDATAAATGTDADSGGGSGGGGGGAYQGGGGGGGPGDSGSPSAGGAGGTAVPAPGIVRGGCDGAASGAAGPAASDPTARSAGGVSGGAIQLTAQVKVKVAGSGRALAGGGAGLGSPTGSGAGGGGAGSGGYLGFDAPEVVFDGRVIANGGGGGASQVFGAAGDPGTDGRPDETAAAGGNAVGGCATAGGDGSAGGTLDGATVAGSVTCGGGGGGGGAGYILVWSPLYLPAGGVMISPAAIITP
jgi:hypothetical protein